MVGIILRYATTGIAELGAQYAAIQKKIVKEQEKQTPFQKWNIDVFHFLNGKLPLAVDIFWVEEVAACHKEQRHVARIYKMVYVCAGASSVA